MTTARIIDTHRLSTLAHEYEREILQFFQDLSTDSGGIERIRSEAERVHFEEIRCLPGERILARIGSGEHVVVMDAQSDATGIAGMIYAAKLIHELGMYDEFTLWVAASLRAAPQGPGWLQNLRDIGIEPACVLFAEPTTWSIRMKEASVEGYMSEAHPLVQAAIATYEALFELPPILHQSPCPDGPLGLPAIGFGPGGDRERVPLRHLLKAAQFYAAFPMTFVESLPRH